MKLFRSVCKTVITAFLLGHSILSADEISVSNSGSDTNSGTKDAPLQSIEKAVEKAAAGDTVVILPGVYCKGAVITKAGTAEKPVKITGTRSDTGKYLTIIEAESKELTSWKKAPEIGKNVLKTKLKSRPDVVMPDGKTIARINRFNMRLPRRDPLPGFKSAYYSGKAPDAGALQYDDEQLMEQFRKMYGNISAEEKLLRETL